MVPAAAAVAAVAAAATIHCAANLLLQFGPNCTTWLVAGEWHFPAARACRVRPLQVDQLACCLHD